MNKKEDSIFKKKIRYHFDKWMSKGPIAQFSMLFVLILMVVTVVGIVVALCDQDVSIGAGVWQSLMHVIDGGTITGDEVDNIRYIILMGIVTIVGLIFTGMLISIINNALDVKMTNLRNGHSQIMEKGHTVIVGFDQNILCIIEELILANDNEKESKAIVVLDSKDVVEMENVVNSYIRSHNFFKKHNLKNPRKTQIIYRSGNVVQKNAYEQVNLDEAKAVIINYDNDFYVLRALLAITTYLKEKNLTNINITTLLHEKKSINSAKFACEEFKGAEILYFEEIIARIMAHVCRQPGLSLVLTEIFGYSGSEFYIEKCDKNGKPLFEKGDTFGDAAMKLSNAILIGIKHNDTNNKQGKIIDINPDVLTPLKEDDELIVMAEDDRMVELKENDSKRTYKNILTSTIDKQDNRKMSNYLVLDWSVSLPSILQELDNYVAPGSKVKIVSDRPFDTSLLAGLNNFETVDTLVLFKKKYDERVCGEDDFSNYDGKREEKDFFDEAVLNLLLEDPNTGDIVTNVLLVCEDGISPEEADAQTMMLLLHLRDIISKNTKYQDINITSEMNTAEDQMLLQVAEVNDFVVGSDIANRIMAQVSNEPKLHELYVELLDAEGSEIYLRNAADYVKLETSMTFGEIEAAVMYGNTQRVNEICLGIKRKGEKTDKAIRLNIKKYETIEPLHEGDQLVVISKGRQ